MSEPIITFENVSKSYALSHHMRGGIKTFLFHLPTALRQLRAQRFDALRNVSFEVAPGESLGVIGHNGAGKSTLLGLMAGVMQPNSGRVTVRGRISPLLQLGAGFHSDLTERENVMLNGVLLGLRRSQVARQMDAIHEFSGLGEFIDEPVRAYSTGMLARLGFSVVAHLDPQILLIDEILAVGDASFHGKCQDKMQAFRKRGVTMILVTHALATVQEMCDRALYLEHGQVQAHGAPQDVIGQYVRRCAEPQPPAPTPTPPAQAPALARPAPPQTPPGKPHATPAR